MTFIESIRHMDKRLRVMLIATALLIVPQIGQFAAIRDLNLSGHESNLAVLFMMAGIFIIPTSFILTVALLATLKRGQRKDLILLGLLNVIISISLTWFFVSPCAWATVVGMYLHTCH
jgi:hypothetical protein